MKFVHENTQRRNYPTTSCHLLLDGLHRWQQLVDHVTHVKMFPLQFCKNKPIYMRPKKSHLILTPKLFIEIRVVFLKLACFHYFQNVTFFFSCILSSTNNLRSFTSNFKLTKHFAANTWWVALIPIPPKKHNVEASGRRSDGTLKQFRLLQVFIKYLISTTHKGKHQADIELLQEQLYSSCTRWKHLPMIS